MMRNWVGRTPNRIILGWLVALSLLLQPLVAIGQESGTPAPIELEEAPVQAPPAAPEPPAEPEPVPPAPEPAPPDPEPAAPPSAPVVADPPSEPAQQPEPAEEPESAPKPIQQPTVAPIPTAERMPTEAPVMIVPNTDALLAVDGVTVFTLQPGETRIVSYTYSVTTGRTGTTIKAQLRDAGEGWSLSSPDLVDSDLSALNATWVERSTLAQGTTFTLRVAITAPVSLTQDQTASLLVWSEAAGLYGNETGVAFTGLPIAAFTAIAPPPIVNTDTIVLSDEPTLRLIPGGNVTVRMIYTVTTPRQLTTLHAALDDGAGNAPVGWTIESPVDVNNEDALVPGATFAPEFVIHAPDQVDDAHTVSLMIWSDTTSERGFEDGIARQPVATIWVAATPEAPIPFAPEVTCTPTDSIGIGQNVWAVQDCTATWATKNVVSVDLDTELNDPAWRVVALDTAIDAETMETGDGHLILADSKSDDDGFHSARFALATQPIACSTADSRDVSVQMRAVSHAPVPVDETGAPMVELAATPEISESYTGSVPASSPLMGAPSIKVSSASFTSIDLTEGDQTSTGSFEFAYANVPAHCGWQVTVHMGDFADGNATIPVSKLEAGAIDGLDATITSPEPGTFVIATTRPIGTSSGTFTLTTLLGLDGFVPQGNYSTTVSLDFLIDP